MRDRDVFMKLCAALRERIRVIEDHAWRDRDPATHLDALRTASEEITNLQTDLPAGTSPTLLHYLQRSSYTKALSFLEDPESKQPTHH